MDALGVGRPHRRAARRRATAELLVEGLGVAAADAVSLARVKVMRRGPTSPRRPERAYAAGHARASTSSGCAPQRNAPNAQEISYTVRRSARARQVRVNVHADAGVEVVLPERAPERAAAAAVSELRPWIERRLEEAREVLARLAERSGTVPYLGSPLELVAEPGRTRAHRRGERLLVPAGDARPAHRALLPPRRAHGDRRPVSIAQPPKPESPTAASTSAPSARAGRRARRVGA